MSVFKKYLPLQKVAYSCTPGLHFVFEVVWDSDAAMAGFGLGLGLGYISVVHVVITLKVVVTILNGSKVHIIQFTGHWL